jgi:hypothetical protein
MWWVIPLGLIGYLVSRWKPSTFGWSVIAVCLAFPNSIVLLVNGNPVMWAMAAMAVAMPHRWVSAFVLLKPSLAPLSVIGIKDWRWWSVLGAAAIVSVALLPLWRDYIAVLGNIRDAGLLYSLGDVPLVLIPGIAWLSRTSNTTLRRDGVTPGHADLPT